MEIIPANLSHIHEIQELAKRTWPIAYKEILDPGQISYMLELFYSPASLTTQIREGQQFYLAKMMERSAGFASWQLKNVVAARLQKLYVLPELQGRKVGKQLLDHVIDEARKSGAGSLELNVNRFNPAISFYQKAGFTISTSKDIDIGNGYYMNDYIMFLEL